MAQTVRMDQVDLEECLVTLDSGADISVLPKSYGNVGQWAPGAETLKMVDAQGKQISHDGITVRTTDSNGKKGLRLGGNVRAGELRVRMATWPYGTKTEALTCQTRPRGAMKISDASVLVQLLHGRV